MSYDFSPELPSIHDYQIGRTYLNPTAPTHITSDIRWLYGAWWARGGFHTSGLYVSVPYTESMIGDRIIEISWSVFNVKPRTIDHTKNRYRLLIGSRQLRRWWEDVVHPDWSHVGVQGVLDIGKWQKDNNYAITLKKTQSNEFLNYVDSLGPIHCYDRKNKNSRDITFLNWEEEWSWIMNSYRL